MNNIPKELQELRANVEIVAKQYQYIKAASTESVPSHDCKVVEIQDLIFRIAGYIHDRISYLENDFYKWTWKHETNHLPNPATPSDMQTALDNLGLSKDFEVKKKTIYASEKFGFEMNKVVSETIGKESKVGGILEQNFQKQ